MYQYRIEEERVNLDSGVVFFDSQTTQTLTNIHLYPPLDACTYMGVDNGATPLRIELYSDIMEALGSSPIAYSCSHMYKITIIRNTYIEWDLTQMAPEDGTCILHYLKPRRQYLDL